MSNLAQIDTLNNTLIKNILKKHDSTTLIMKYVTISLGRYV